MPWTSGAFIASADTVSAVTTDSAHEVRPLTSSPPIPHQSWGGAQWRRISDRCCTAVHSYPYLVLVLCCTVPVYEPLCIQKKPVLSQLLSLLTIHRALLFLHYHIRLCPNVGTLSLHIVIALATCVPIIAWYRTTTCGVIAPLS
jgi:hypothetical protein